MIRSPLTPDPLSNETLASQHVEASHVVSSPLQDVPLPLFTGVPPEHEKVAHVAAASKGTTENTGTQHLASFKKGDEVKTHPGFYK